MVASNLDIPEDQLAEFCRKWRIARLEVFGSALREDFGSESDVDLLVTFEKDAPWSLLELARMKRDASALFARSVDILTRRSVEAHHNPWTRHYILSSVRTIYQAA